MKEVVTLTIVSCTSLGCCIGGTLNAIDSFRYHSALTSPSFAYLVDEVGNPVSKKVK